MPIEKHIGQNHLKLTCLFRVLFEFHVFFSHVSALRERLDPTIPHEPEILEVIAGSWLGIDEIWLWSRPSLARPTCKIQMMSSTHCQEVSLY